MRGMKDCELEAYIVFTEPLEQERAEAVLNELGDLKREFYPTEKQNLIRAARISGDADAVNVLNALRDRLAQKELRWLEIGLRGYGLIKGKREFKPWRRNAYLNHEALEKLKQLEPEVRYHAPS
jgi:hypothetical protein